MKCVPKKLSSDHIKRYLDRNPSLQHALRDELRAEKVVNSNLVKHCCVICRERDSSAERLQ